VIDAAVLDRLREVPFCLIGASALAVHGLARFSADVDLLTMDPTVLSDHFWAGLPDPPEIRSGDLEDPLRGVVRWRGEPPLDPIVGRGLGRDTRIPARLFAEQVLPAFAA
jgi:hypothetical protein